MPFGDGAPNTQSYRFWLDSPWVIFSGNDRQEDLDMRGVYYTFPGYTRPTSLQTALLLTAGPTTSFLLKAIRFYQESWLGVGTFNWFLSRVITLGTPAGGPCTINPTDVGSGAAQTTPLGWLTTEPTAYASPITQRTCQGSGMDNWEPLSDAEEVLVDAGQSIGIVIYSPGSPNNLALEVVLQESG